MPCLIKNLHVQNILGLKIAEFIPIGKKFSLSDSNTTSTIVSLLLSIGYDVRLGLTEDDSICGVYLKDVIRQGYEKGETQVTLDLASSAHLTNIYGSDAILTRVFQRGCPTSASTFSIMSCNNIAHVLEIHQLESLMNHLIPLHMLRLIVLNAENSQYFARDHKLLSQAIQLSLSDRLLKHGTKPPTYRFYTQALNVLNRSFYENVDQIHGYSGGINWFGSIESVHVWIKKIEKIQRGKFFLNRRANIDLSKECPKTLEEVDQFWHRLTYGKRAMAIEKFYFTCWAVIDSIPMVICDANSHYPYEFSLSAIGFMKLEELCDEDNSKFRQYVIPVDDDSD